MIPGLGAFFACLVMPLQLGILVGIGINVIFILYQAARPKLRIETLSVSGKCYVMLELGSKRILFICSRRMASVI